MSENKTLKNLMAAFAGIRSKQKVHGVCKESRKRRKA